MATVTGLKDELPANRLSVYTSSYRLLEESRKSWQYIFSDRLVYLFNSVEVALQARGAISKDYLEGNCWIEGHLVFEFDGRAYHMLLIVELQNGQHIPRNRPLEIANHSVHGDSSMLVKIREFTELPEVMASNGNGIPSVIWLKVFDDCGGFAGNPSDLLLENSIISLRQNGKLNPPLGGIGCQSSKSPNGLIQRGPQATEEVSNDKPNVVRHFFDFPSKTMPLPFNIILAEESVGLRFVESGKLIPKRLKMIFRPGCFEVGLN